MDMMQKLEAAYNRAMDNVEGNMVLMASITEFVRIAQRGLTESEIEYWTDRLNDLVDAA